MKPMQNYFTAQETVNATLIQIPVSYILSASTTTLLHLSEHRLMPYDSSAIEVMRSGYIPDV